MTELYPLKQAQTVGNHLQQLLADQDVYKLPENAPLAYQTSQASAWPLAKRVMRRSKIHIKASKAFLLIIVSKTAQIDKS